MKPFVNFQKKMKRYISKYDRFDDKRIYQAAFKTLSTERGKATWSLPISTPSAVRPPEIEVSVTTVYLRRNIVETEREEMDERKSTIFTYEGGADEQGPGNVLADGGAE